MSKSEKCPKCSNTMWGPRFEAATESLVYKCACGYQAAKPTHDSAERIKSMMENPKQVADLNR